MKKPTIKRQTVEMIDGRTYYSHDNWATVWLSRGGNRSLVEDKEEADRVRFTVAMGAADKAMEGR